MKKIWIGILTAALAVVLCTTGAFAIRGNYVDADGDGICDNRGTGGGNYVDADGDGICDNRGTGGGNYVDADGDGICDNRGAGGGAWRGRGYWAGRN